MWQPQQTRCLLLERGYARTRPTWRWECCGFENTLPLRQWSDLRQTGETHSWAEFYHPEHGWLGADPDQGGHTAAS